MCIYTHIHVNINICLFIYLFIHLFIYTSTEHSHLCEVNSSLSSHKILIIVSNLMVHHSVHQIPSPVHTTCQINPVHTLQFYFLLINFNITLPSTLWSSMSSPSFRFSHQNLAWIFFSLPCTVQTPPIPPWIQVLSLLVYLLINFIYYVLY